MEMLRFGKYQRAAVKQGKSSILHWLWITAAVPCLLLSGTSWAEAVLALPCQGSSQESELSSPPVCGAGLCHLGIPMEGVCKRQPRKDNPVMIRLEHPPWPPSATPMKKLEQFTRSEWWNPEAPQASRQSQAEEDRFGTSVPVSVFTQPCHAPQAPDEFSHSDRPSPWRAGMVLQPSPTSRMWPGVGFLNETGLQLSHLKHRLNYKSPCCALKKKNKLKVLFHLA